MSNELKAGLIVTLIISWIGLMIVSPLIANLSIYGLFAFMVLMMIYMIYRLVLDILNYRKK